MSTTEIISLVITCVGVVCFATAFTILYRTYAHSSIVQIESGKRDIELIDKALNEKSENYKRKKKRNSVIKTVIFAVVLAILIPLFVFALYTRFGGGTFFNKSVMVVASGSMSMKNEANPYLEENGLDNQFKTYDIIVLEKVEAPSDLKLYDVIAYRNNEGINVIHRIISLNQSDGELRFTTRGDANNETDTYQPKFDDVIGRYTGARIAGVGIVIMFLQDYAGMITVASLLYCLFMIDAVYRRIERAEKGRTEKLLAVIEGAEEENAAAMHAEFKETIYYKGFAYHFDESGFVEKAEAAGEDNPAQSDNAMVKVVECGESTTSREIIIETRNDDGEKA